MNEKLKNADELTQPERINNTMGKMGYYLKNHESICVSISGGSDSDIILHIIATYFREHLSKIHFVFSDTGVEYRATLNHLDDLEKKYGIEIQRTRGMPIPQAIKEYGVPFASKKFSDYFERLQKHGFTWENSDFNSLSKKYHNCQSALQWWCNEYGDKSQFNIGNKKGLKELILSLDHVPKISMHCCSVSKKRPLQQFQKSVHADLVISGERKYEWGARASVHSSCFGRRDGMDHYMPLFFWNDETKAYYKRSEGIVYSDCYEKYGLKRTGCVGCPFARNRKEELKIMEEFEPNLYKACINIFGEAYQLDDRLKELQEELRQSDKDGNKGGCNE